MTLLFIKKVKREGGGKIDEAKVLIATITHDWVESILLDVPSSSPSYQSYFSEINLRTTIKSAEVSVNRQMEKFIDGELTLDIGTDELNDKEKAIFKIADLTANLLEILEWRYHGLQYEWFDYIWSNLLKRLRLLIDKSVPEISEILDELTDAYEKGKNPLTHF